MKNAFPIAQLCLALGVSRSGFYAWSHPRPSLRREEDAKLQSSILQAHLQSRRTYGSPRIRAELRAAGLFVGRRRIARLMRQTRISGRSRAKRLPLTTDSQHDHPIAPNLLRGRARASAINQVWVTDIC